MFGKTISKLESVELLNFQNILEIIVLRAFVSLNLCIQHFPSIAWLIGFAGSVSNS